MSYEPQFDEMLFAILNHSGGIDKFLDVMFFFLYRRTDFFKIKKSSSEKLGLPPGVAQKMVKMICQRYVQLEKARNPSTTDPDPSPAKDCKKDEKSAIGKPSEEQETKNVAKQKSSEQQETKVCAKITPSVQQEPSEQQETQDEVDPTLQDSDFSKEGKIPKANEVDPTLQDSDLSKEGKIPKAKDKPAKATKKTDSERGYYDSNPECYNGASYDKYSWAQDIYELEVQVKVPKNVRSGDQVKVAIKRTHLRVEALQDENWEVILDGELSYDIKLEGSTWTLHPSDHIHVQLVKGYERFWDALVEGEPKINVREIDCSKPYEDLEQEAQAKLQEMMFDQQQKMLGKPTSKQIKVQDILKQAWDKNNSPFKGQKFDPSLFNVAE